jgi:Fe-S-cluster-containing hydrogenase component 2
MKMTVTEDCIDCASCEYACPSGAPYAAGGKHEIDPERCDGCQGRGEPACRLQCPVDGIVPVDSAVRLAKAV